MIRRITSRLSASLSARSWVRIGPGDDAAVVEPERGTLDVLTTDAVVEGVHFDRAFVPLAAVGHRALAVNLSDLAAMGARPRAALLSLVLPESLDVTEVDQLLDGLLPLAEAHGVALVGGNITRTTGPLVIDVTAVGSVKPRKILTRTGARPGDEIYVTGSLGAAAVGLLMLRDGAPGWTVGGAQQPTGTTSSDRAEGTASPAEESRACVERYLRPVPRVRAGVLLGRTRAASSAMDLSDGLADALAQVAEMSAVGMRVDIAALPIAQGVRDWHATHGGDPLDSALSGGDDYELLFTVRPTHRGRLRGVRKQLGDLAITRIGVVAPGREVVLATADGARPLPRGFDHFQ